MKRRASGPDASRQEPLTGPSSPLADLCLTLPIFVTYHLGVVFLPVRNGADWVTRELVTLADDHLGAYVALTLGIGAAFVLVLKTLGRSDRLSLRELGLLALEGIVYAAAMRVLAAQVVGRMPLAADLPATPDGFELTGAPAAIVMSLGAGFYEELAFRVGLYGLGAMLWLRSLPHFGLMRRFLVRLVWAAVAAAAFSAWHHVGPLGEPWDARVFVFRWVCGMTFTAIYAFRGFAPAVWTHALYDVWVLAL